MIDILEDISDQMQIVLKSEPLSPGSINCDDLESCLRLVHERVDAPREESLGSGYQEPRSPTRRKCGNASVTDRRCPGRGERSGRAAIGGTYCELCQKSFSRAWSLQRHMADTHFYVPQSLTCELCGRHYKSRNSLVSHKSQYHTRKER
jgi:hypothetical protein